MLKESAQAEKKSPQLETRRLQNGKVRGEGKRIGKVGNHPHASMAPEPVTEEEGSVSANEGRLTCAGDREIGTFNHV